jgi:cytochrome oxidase assembly protein ShyY1
VRAGRKQSVPQVCKMGVNVFGAPSKKESVLVTIDPKHTATSKADDLRYTAGLAWLGLACAASASVAVACARRASVRDTKQNIHPMNDCDETNSNPRA